MTTMMNLTEKYNCSICNTEINTSESKMITDRDEDFNIRGLLCIDCSCAVHREDPFVLLRAIEYILGGGDPNMFEDSEDGPPKPKKIRRGLTEQDRDLLEELTGKREFTTLRDDEFSIQKLKGKRKAGPKKKPATKKKRKAKTTVKKRSSAPDPELHQDYVSESVGN
jgi:hypothetical protein